jgi:hypothetical protein
MVNFNTLEPGAINTGLKWFQLAPPYEHVDVRLHVVGVPDIGRQGPNTFRLLTA